MVQQQKSPSADYIYGYNIDIAWEEWPAVSDGVATNVPTLSAKMLESSDSSWRRILGKVWVDLIPLDREEGHVYELRRLPPGYSLYERLRRDHNGNDYFIYGHPSGKCYESVELFSLHFLHLCMLMHGKEHICECVLCAEMRKIDEKDDVDGGIRRIHIRDGRKADGEVREEIENENGPLAGAVE